MGGGGGGGGDAECGTAKPPLLPGAARCCMHAVLAATPALTLRASGYLRSAKKALPVRKCASGSSGPVEMAAWKERSAS